MRRVSGCIGVSDGDEAADLQAAVPRRMAAVERVAGTVSAVTRRVRWTAGRDGLAHAHEGRLSRTVCGVPAVSEQFAWPARGRCPDCVAIVDPGSQLSEELLFAGYRNTEAPIAD